MKTGFHSVGLDSWPIDEVMRAVAGRGYDTVELNAETLPWAGPHVGPDTTPAERARIRDLARELGIGISSISAHASLIEDDAAARGAALAYTLGCIDLAADLGVRDVHILSGPPPEGVDPERAWGWLVDTVRAGSRHARDRGVRLSIEAIVGHLVSGSDDIMRLNRELGDDRIWVNFDPSHYEVMGEDPVEAARRLAPLVVHAHLKDAEGVPEDFTFPPLGEGAIDFAGVVRELRAAGYHGVLSAEYEAQVYGFGLTPDEILDQSLAFARSLAAGEGDAR